MEEVFKEERKGAVEGLALEETRAQGQDREVD
jgi:hypothetical protein